MYEKFHDLFFKSSLWRQIAYFRSFLSRKADYQRGLELNSSVSEYLWLAMYESSSRREAREASVDWCFPKKSSGEI